MGQRRPAGRLAPALVALIAWVAPAAPVAAADPAGTPAWTTLLDAGFQGLPSETPLPTGTPAQGRPVSIDPNLIALVRDTPMASRSVQFAWKQFIGSGFIRFEFIDGAEPRDGVASLRLHLHPQVFDAYTLLLREAKGAAQSFSDVLLRPDGGIRANDLAGSTLLPATWVPGRTYAIEWLVDLDAETYDLRVDGRVALAGRPLVIDLDDPLQAGLGSVSIGLLNSATVNALASFDDLLVRHATGLAAEDLIFNAALDPW